MKLSDHLQGNKYELREVALEVLGANPIAQDLFAGRVWVAQGQARYSPDGTLIKRLGEYTITVTGEADGTGTDTLDIVLLNDAVIGKVLTGLDTGTTGVVAAADSILAAIGKLQHQATSLGGSSHTQNTDAGTTSPSFYIDGPTGPKIKNNAGVVELTNAAETDFVDLRVKNLFVTGSQTHIDSNVVDIGDSELELNADITASAQNSDGGIAVKRLAPDNVTLRDAKLNFNNTTGRWEAYWGPVAAPQLVMTIVLQRQFQIGDGSTLAFDVTHNLSNPAPMFWMWDTVNNEPALPKITFPDANTAHLEFGTPAPSNNQYILSLHG